MMNQARIIAAMIFMLAPPLVAIADDAVPVTAPAATAPADVPPAAEAKALVADDFKITYRQIVLQCETDLETGMVQNTGPGTLDCTITVPAGVISGSVEPRITSIIDDAGHKETFTFPPELNPGHRGAHAITQFNNREGRPFAQFFRVSLNKPPAPPRTIAEVRGELIVKVMRVGKPFVFSLEKEGEEIAIDKTSAVKLRAVSRDGKKLGVGISFEGVTKSVHDKTSPPYLVRVVLLDKDGKALDAAARRTVVVPSMTEAVYTFECPDAESKVSLRVDVVTEMKELVIPVELKLKPGKK